MSHKKLMMMEELLIAEAEKQFECLESVCTEELGEVIDMIKDLKEAIYYEVITKTMQADKTLIVTENSNEEMLWDEQFGCSPHSRKRYLEAKIHGKDKATQLRELEKYMQELNTDMIEMVNEATVEERAYLEKKVAALAAKIGQIK